MTATDKYVAIMDALMAGRTVYLQTSLKAIKISQRNVDQWANVGRPLLKVVGKSLYVARGKSYDCADYCAITIR